MGHEDARGDAEAVGGLVATMIAHDAVPGALTDTLAAGSSARRGPPGTPDRLAIGSLIGRHIVVGTLGAGGMGVVYAGYDPELDRKVALKLLHAELGGSGSLGLESGRTRLLREAQALARLAHPNVVAIHDVGEHEGNVWLAMEHIEGVTLDQWLKEAPRTTHEVLEVMLAAGRGLAAAHEAGLVHRDFKPANVMVGRDGRTRVMDLGLARAARPADGAPTVRPSEVLATRTNDLQVTQAGAVLGTPAYMSPEQMSGREPDVRSDVFSFCVTLYEALHGERPFAGETLVEMVANVIAGNIRRPAQVRGRSVPGWLRRACAQGLAVAPAQRFASMTALISALERGRARARRGRWLAIGLGVAALAGAAVGAERYDMSRRTAACAAEGAVIDEVWDDAARARVRAGMLATGARFGPQSLEILLPWLDAYRDAWSEGRASACVHATIERDWDAERIDRASWCFEDRRLQLEATVEQLSTLDRASARRAVRIASYLDPVATCLDPVLVQRLPAPPLALRDEIRAIRATLSESDTLRHGGRFAEALAVATRARSSAEALGWSPLLSLARFTEGRCAIEVGNYEDAEGVLLRAYFAAQRDGSTEVAFRAARSLVIVLVALKRYHEAEVWSRHADLFAASLDDPGGLDAAEGHYLMSEVQAGLGDDEAATAEGEAAVAMRTATLGPDHPITAAALRHLGQRYLEAGRAREAMANFDHALAVWEEAVGHEHPQIAELTVLRGLALWELGRVDEALELLREGLALHTRVVGGDHPRILRVVAELGRAALALGRVDEAEPLLRRVMDDVRARHGPRHRRSPRASSTWPTSSARADAASWRWCAAPRRSRSSTTQGRSRSSPSCRRSSESRTSTARWGAVTRRSSADARRWPAANPRSARRADNSWRR